MSQHPEVTPPYKPMQLYDIRAFEVGQVYYIDDELISIPEADRTIHPRKTHHGRRVVIAHNNYLNTDPTWPLIHVAPLSHRVDLMRETDIEVTTDRKDGNAVTVNSIIMLSLVQPVLKVDLRECVGKLSRDKIVEMLSLQEEMLVGTLEPLEEE